MDVHFRCFLFLIVNYQPQGEVSRAMRNRCMEIAFLPDVAVVTSASISPSTTGSFTDLVAQLACKRVPTGPLIHAMIDAHLRFVAVRVFPCLAYRGCGAARLVCAQAARPRGASGPTVRALLQWADSVSALVSAGSHLAAHSSVMDVMRSALSLE